MRILHSFLCLPFLQPTPDIVEIENLQKLVADAKKEGLEEALVHEKAMKEMTNLLLTRLQQVACS
jgi:hypothetical protein